MKDLGEFLKETRVNNCVELEEAADDLGIDSVDLENIEAGNIRAFKDVLSLKVTVKDYAKYLGLDPEKVIDEFNDFLFEHTSKISLEDILAAEKKKIEEEKKVVSPYTYVRKRKINKKAVAIVLGCIIALIVVIKIGMWIIEPKEEKINTELLEISTKDGVYEFTYKTDNY